MSEQPSIQVACGVCCNISMLRASAFHVTVFDSGVGDYYSFFCPHCTEESRHPMDEALVLTFTRLGVRLTVEHVPLEVLEPKGGPPISSDDIMDFVLEMASLDRAFA